MVTKLWNTYHNKKHVRAAFEKQRKELGLDYIDLYIIHCKFFPLLFQVILSTYHVKMRKKEKQQPDQQDFFDFQKKKKKKKKKENEIVN